MGHGVVEGVRDHGDEGGPEARRVRADLSVECGTDPTHELDVDWRCSPRRWCRFCPFATASIAALTALAW